MPVRHPLVAAALGRLRNAALPLQVLLFLMPVVRPANAGNLHGFLDGRGGRRIGRDAYQRDTSLAEMRLQLQWEQRGEASDARLRADLLYDHLADDHQPDLETGRGAIDWREAYIFVFPAEWADIKLGRQILTWGTGDLLFINDLFPKDWQAFFIGRDEEYLKAPSDAVLLSLFPGGVNIDLVYVPRFDADRSIRGERISYYNPSLGRRAGRDAVIETQPPDDWFSDDEIALRIYGQANGIELAGYAYDGYTKSPQGFDPATRRAIHPRLRVYGASLRMMLASGILNTEAGYYDALDNRRGDNPWLPNSAARFLLGFERELAMDLNLGLQYYLEHTLEYAAYRRNLPDGTPANDENRHVLTVRLTRRAFNQKLLLSGFLYYSPSDHDLYLRASSRYALSDHWSVSCGGNYFRGAQPHTFFGQFRDNSNLYAAIRRSF